MQHVFIAGSRGQLGCDCMRVFSDCRTTGADLPETDLSDRMQCLEVLDRNRPDVIINCAAYTAVDACETDPACHRVNADLPGHLAGWAEEHGAFLVQLSTDYVFSGEKPLYQPWVETDPPAPVSAYGRSKLAGELAITDRTQHCAILRTAWLYGAAGKNFLKTMLRLARQHPGRPLKVVDDQFGSPTWSYTLARQIRAVAERRAAGIFHASSEGYCSWHALACRFLERMGIDHAIMPCTTAEYPTPARRPVNSIMENARLKALGINLFRDWREELDEFTTLHGKDLLKELEGS